MANNLLRTNLAERYEDYSTTPLSKKWKLNVFVAFWISVDLVEASGFQFGALDKGFINFTNKFNVVVIDSYS